MQGELFKSDGEVVSSALITGAMVLYELSAQPKPIIIPVSAEAGRSEADMQAIKHALTEASRLESALSQKVCKFPAQLHAGKAACNISACDVRQRVQVKEAAGDIHSLEGELAAEHAAAESLSSNASPHARQVHPPLTVVVQGAHATAGTSA